MAIRVLVLLDKGGTNTDVHHLGSLSIVNQGTPGTRRTYKVTQHAKGRNPRVVNDAMVEDFPSPQVSIWKLVAAALRELGHEA